MRSLLLTVLAGTAVLAGLLTAPATAAATADADVVRGQLLTLVDADRDAAGLHVLEADACLMANAQRHAERLARTGRLAHQDLGRLMQECRGHGVYGENVQWSSTGTARSMLRRWLASPTHAANLHKATYRLTGIGVAYDRGARRWYAVQVFTSR